MCAGSVSRYPYREELAERQDRAHKLSKKPARDRGGATRPLIAVVGPCASGKSMLVRRLQREGYNAREVNQEHSYVPSMWQRLTDPDVLIYLHVSQEVAAERRKSEERAAWWKAMEERLEHASRHADLRIQTDALTPDEVLREALVFLERSGYEANRSDNAVDHTQASTGP